MWIAYYNAYQNKATEKAAWLHLEKTNARILLIAGAEEKVIVYPHGSHLNGMMPDREREKKLYRMILLIGMMYRTFGKYRKENLEYFEQTEREIIKWLQ